MSSTFTFARWLFARALGAVFLCAFVSLGVQVRGLFGSRGVAPAADLLQRVHEHLGPAAYWKVPTLCWLGAGDGMLVALCWAGAALAVAMLCGVCPGACSLLAWALYLSLCSVGSPFLNFQWDALLLETAFLAAFVLPWGVRPDWHRHTRVSRLAWLLLWWLCFRLIFESGLVKITAGDPAWLQLTALGAHFETQPIPLPTAWLAHQTPGWLLQIATFLMFAVELAVPFLILAPRRWRHAGALALIAFQLCIMATGNYAFFNWLTIALCIPLFDDTAWPARCLRWLPAPRPPAAEPRWTLWLFAPVAFTVVLLTAAELEQSFHQRDGWRPRWKPIVAGAMEALQPLRSFNGYGLFRVMTTSRPEVVIEGSTDGEHWREYEFRYKAGDVRRRPPFVAPHQPRLDWQMWFAALGDVRHNPWFVNLLVRLLEGSPDVLALLEWNPFPSQPPRYVRAVLYDYRFTHAGEDATAWWRREPRGLYCPPLSLKKSAQAPVGAGK